MARGWESKSVEDQIGAAEAAMEDRAKLHLSEQERVKETQRQSLLMSRTQISARISKATNAQYRSQLEKALAHLEKQLAELDQSG